MRTSVRQTATPNTGLKGKAPAILARKQTVNLLVVTALMKAHGIHPLEKKAFSYYKSKSKVELLERDTNIRHTGYILGFDEHMNVVFRTSGRHFMIKGDCISCILLRN